MFITNKRVVIPEFIEIEQLKIQVVKEFKSLVFKIDRKLDFVTHIALQSLSINKMLYAIKRIFYLQFNFQVQLFKTFILPYFDYGLSLCIYFQKPNIRRLCKMYYLCLNKLFNFNFRDQTHEQIKVFLKQYNLFSFKHRLTYRLSLFLHKIIYNNKSPIQLKVWLTAEEQNNTIYMYKLRSNNKKIFQASKSCSKFGDLTFKKNFSRLLNKLNFLEVTSSFYDFKNDLLNSKNYALILLF